MQPLCILERFHTKPILVQKPENVTAAVGGNASMTCKIFSDLHAYINWVKQVNTSDLIYYDDSQVPSFHVNNFFLTNKMPDRKHLLTKIHIISKNTRCLVA